MGNIYLTPNVIARMMLANLYATNVMAGLVWRDFDADFDGKVGDTVTIRKPAMYQARRFDPTVGIQVQTGAEEGIPVTLDQWWDVSTPVTSKQLTLEIADFRAQVIDPMTEPLVQQIDQALLDLRDDITQEVGTVTGETWDMPESMIAAGRELDKKKVATGNRSCVVGPTTGAQWSKTELMKRTDQRGDTQGRLEASLGARLFGMDPYKTNHIEVPEQVTGNSTTEVGVAFHQTAFALVTRPIALPMGAKNAAIVPYKGFALRVIIDYDQSTKQDIISVDTLFGVKTIDANRACLIKGVDN